MKRLIQTRININPYKVYQLQDCFVAELNDVEVFRTKHQHLCTSYCQIKLAEEKNERNRAIIESINQLKADGII